MRSFSNGLFHLCLVAAMAALAVPACTKGRQSSGQITSPAAAGPGPITPPIKGNEATAQGTADGSGGETQKSDHTLIEKALFDPAKPHTSLKRRLTIAFYRYANAASLQNVPGLKRFRPPTQEKQFGTPDREGADKIIVRMLMESPKKDLFQAIDDLQFAIQDLPCRSDDGVEKEMAIKDGKVCISNERLKNIPPENLEEQMTALAAHELAHDRGITSEVDANRVRDFFTANYRALVKPAPSLINVQEYLALTLPYTEFAIDHTESETFETRCHNLYFALKTLTETSSNSETFTWRKLSDSFEWLADAGRELESGHCRKSKVLFYSSLRNPRLPLPVTGAPSYWQNVKSVLLKSLAFQSFNDAFSSPYFRWENAVPHQLGKQVLLYNAESTSFNEQGKFTENASNFALTQSSLTCSVDGEPLTFTKAACPEPTAESSNGTDNEGAYLQNLRNEALGCARKDLKDSRGQQHTLHLIADHHSLYDLNFDATPENVIGVQVILNYDHTEKGNTHYERLTKNYAKFLRVEGENMMTPKNNVALLDYSNRHSEPVLPRAHGLYSVLHRTAAPSTDVRIHLAVGYDLKTDAVQFETPSHRVQCSVK